MGDTLREIPRVRQERGATGRRRWLTCASADLYLFEADGELVAFELCVGKPRAEKSFIWSRAEGLRHAAIDSGEDSALHNRTPIAVAGGAVPDLDQAALEFERLAGAVDSRAYRTVLRVLHLGR